MHKKDQPVENRRKSGAAGRDDAFLTPPPPLSKHEWRLVFGQKPRRLQTSHFKRWQLQEAKAKFSEVFERTFKDGPQVVTRHNKQAVVIVPEEEFRKLADGPSKPEPGMLETLLKCPKGPDLKITEQDKGESILDLPPIFD